MGNSKKNIFIENYKEYLRFLDNSLTREGAPLSGILPDNLSFYPSVLGTILELDSILFNPSGTNSNLVSPLEYSLLGISHLSSASTFASFWSPNFYLEYLDRLKAKNALRGSYGSQNSLQEVSSNTLFVDDEDSDPEWEFSGAPVEGVNSFDDLSTLGLNLTLDLPEVLDVALSQGTIIPEVPETSIMGTISDVEEIEVDEGIKEIADVVPSLSRITDVPTYYSSITGTIFVEGGFSPFDSYGVSSFVAKPFEGKQGDVVEDIEQVGEVIANEVSVLDLDNKTYSGITGQTVDGLDLYGISGFYTDSDTEELTSPSLPVLDLSTSGNSFGTSQSFSNLFDDEEDEKGLEGNSPSHTLSANEFDVDTDEDNPFYQESLLEGTEEDEEEGMGQEELEDSFSFTGSSSVSEPRPRSPRSRPLRQALTREGVEEDSSFDDKDFSFDISSGFGSTPVSSNPKEEGSIIQSKSTPTGNVNIDIGEGILAKLGQLENKLLNKMKKGKQGNDEI